MPETETGLSGGLASGGGCLGFGPPGFVGAAPTEALLGRTGASSVTETEKNKWETIGFCISIMTQNLTFIFYQFGCAKTTLILVLHVTYLIYFFCKA